MKDKNLKELIQIIEAGDIKAKKIAMQIHKNINPYDLAPMMKKMLGEDDKQAWEDIERKYYTDRRASNN